MNCVVESLLETTLKTEKKKHGTNVLIRNIKIQKPSPDAFLLLTSPFTCSGVITGQISGRMFNKIDLVKSISVWDKW